MEGINSQAILEDLITDPIAVMLMSRDWVNADDVRSLIQTMANRLNWRGASEECPWPGLGGPASSSRWNDRASGRSSQKNPHRMAGAALRAGSGRTERPRAL
jgi:hypothetical protein